MAGEREEEEEGEGVGGPVTERGEARGAARPPSASSAPAALRVWSLDRGSGKTAQVLGEPVVVLLVLLHRG